jgi:type III restriction enzyme
VWTRNATSSETSYSIPLPAKVGDSSRFYPDFIWWLDSVCWAIDTTGRHLLSDKVRGKLIALNQPKVALVVRGDIEITGDVKSKDGWTVIVARQSLKPVVEHLQDLEDALQILAKP